MGGNRPKNLMQLHSVLFPGQFTDKHARMLDVLRWSVRQNTQHELVVHEIDEPDPELREMAYPGCKQQWIDNARKAKHHNRIIQEASDGDVLCMLDADTMVLEDLSEVEGMDFDIAYTVRPPGNKWKLNTGVYFVRVSWLSKLWSYAWFLLVSDLLKDEWRHNHWKKTKGYGGIHQAALGCLLESRESVVGVEALRYLKLIPLPCETWNCVSFTWDTAQSPKIVHIMGQLREIALNPKKKAGTANMQRWVDLWRAYDKQVREQEVEREVA